MVSLIIINALMLLVLGYLIFYKSFAQEKGKNLATKQDIEDITRKVEGVKQEIQYLTQSKFNLKQEERLALVNCYERFYNWLTTCIETYFSDISLSSVHKLEERDSKIETARVEYNLSKGRLELYMDNSEISALFDQLNLDTLDVQNFVSKFVMNYEHLFSEERHIQESQSGEERLKSYSEFLDKRNKMHKEFLEERVEKYKKISPLNAKLQGVICQYLKSEHSV